MHKLILALAATVAFAGSAFAEPVRISVGSYNLNNLPFPVAAGLGLYEKEGLEVTVENFASGGSKTLQALVAGEADVVGDLFGGNHGSTSFVLRASATSRVRRLRARPTSG